MTVLKYSSVIVHPALGGDGPRWQPLNVAVALSIGKTPVRFSGRQQQRRRQSFDRMTSAFVFQLRDGWQRDNSGAVQFLTVMHSKLCDLDFVHIQPCILQ